LWCAFSGWKDFEQLPQSEKVRVAAETIAYVADKLDEIGCSLGLYNHGGWFGEPENQIEIIKFLKNRILVSYLISAMQKPRSIVSPSFSLKYSPIYIQ
jgi:hypothetical protein